MLRRMLRKGDVRIAHVEEGAWSRSNGWWHAPSSGSPMLLDVSRITIGMLRLDLAPFELRALLHEVAESFMDGAALVEAMTADPTLGASRSS